MYKAITHSYLKDFIPEDIKVIKEKYSDDTYEIDTNIGTIRYVKNIKDLEETFKKFKKEVEDPIINMLTKQPSRSSPYLEPTRFNLILTHLDTKSPEVAKIIKNEQIVNVCFTIQLHFNRMPKPKEVTYFDTILIGYIMNRIKIQIMKHKFMQLTGYDRLASYINCIANACIIHTKIKVIPFFVERNVRLWLFYESGFLNELENVINCLIKERIEYISKFIDFIQNDYYDTEDSPKREELTTEDYFIEYLEIHKANMDFELFK